LQMIPAKAGTYLSASGPVEASTPAFAGITVGNAA